MRGDKLTTVMWFSLIVVLSAITQPEAQDNAAASNVRVPIFTGAYLGQQAPGPAPELFAPGAVSRADYSEHSAAVFSPDLSEVYWSAKPNDERYYNIYFMKMNGESWTTPRAVTFLEHNYSERGPVFAPDGNKLYFEYNGDIWMVERQADGWSEPMLVTEISDSVARDRICSVTEDGSVYLVRSGSLPDVRELFVSRMKDGDLSMPVKSDKVIPTGYWAVGDIFVAPDESYMILELHVDNGTSELFASYRMKDGSWSDEIKLPVGWGRCPAVSPDGRYLFFMRREGIYWANAGILRELEPAEAK